MTRAIPLQEYQAEFTDDRFGQDCGYEVHYTALRGRGEKHLNEPEWVTEFEIYNVRLAAIGHHLSTGRLPTLAEMAEYTIGLDDPAVVEACSEHLAEQWENMP